MPCEVNFNSDNRIVETIFTGMVTMKDLEWEMEKSTGVGTKHDCRRYLADVTTATTSLSKTDVLSLPVQYSKLEDATIMRVALLRPADENAKAMVELFAAASELFGHETKCFDDREPAVEWLLLPGRV